MDNINNTDGADSSIATSDSSVARKPVLKYISYAGLLLAGVVVGLLTATALSGGSLMVKEAVVVVEEETAVAELDATPATDEVLITTQGSSKVSQESDVAIINGTITGFGLTSQEALDSVNYAYTALNSYLTTKGLSEAVVANVSVTPEYEETGQDSMEAEVAVEEVSPEGEVTESPVVPVNPEPYGYTARQSFSVKSPQEGASSLLKEIVAIAPSIEINYISQEVSNLEDLTSKALELAVQDAENKANQYATMLGIEIVNVRAINERNTQGAPVVAYSEAAREDYKPVDVDLFYTVEIIFVGRPI